MLPYIANRRFKEFVEFCMLNDIKIENDEVLVVDEWDLEAEQSIYRKELAFVYARFMTAHGLLKAMDCTILRILKALL